MRRRTESETTLILLNGDLRPETYKELRRTLRRSAKRGFAIIAADGGARHAAALGVEPRLVIGDMDSLPRKRPPWRSTVYLCDFGQDSSDFEKALRFLQDRGVKEASVAGLTGGAPDHALVNLALFERFSRRMALTCLDGGWLRLLGPGEHALPCRRGDRVSLLPEGASAKATTSGLRYPLSRGLIGRSSLGLSNRALSSEVRLRIHSGRLWVSVSRPR